MPDGDYAAYIEEEAGVKVPEGNFVLTDGTVLGRHKGITHYTVGQRKGLGSGTWISRICFGDPSGNQ